VDTRNFLALLKKRHRFGQRFQKGTIYGNYMHPQAPFILIQKAAILWTDSAASCLFPVSIGLRVLREGRNDYMAREL